MSAQVDPDQYGAVMLFTRYTMQSSRNLRGKGSPNAERSRPKAWVNSEKDIRGSCRTTGKETDWHESAVTCRFQRLVLLKFYCAGRQNLLDFGDECIARGHAETVAQQ